MRGRSLEPILCSDEKSWKELFVEREFRSKTFMGRYTVDMLYGHTEDVRKVFVLSSKKLVFTSVAADSRLLVAGGTGGFIHGWKATTTETTNPVYSHKVGFWGIHGWKANDGNPHLFDLSAPHDQDVEFQVWEHDGPITCLGTRVFVFGSIFSRMFESFVASTAGLDLYVWDTNSGSKLAIINNAHAGYTYSLARSHTGKLLYTGGEDGVIHMFEIFGNASDGKLSLIDVRKLLTTNRNYIPNNSSKTVNLAGNVEPPQRMLYGFGSNLFAVDAGCNRIVCAGEEGVVRIWNFSQALEIEQRVRALRGGHGSKPWKQPLAEMQGKTAYNRPLWLGPSPDLEHHGSFSATDCP
ncbi:putative transcription factor GAMYB-like isoform X1 [Capsicum annuum]|nr:putative transcription factor GAMYB-like isoform X1 [Capsicum annuum]